MTDRPNMRAKRLAVQRKAQDALGSLRALTRVLVELERLQDAADDSIGYVRIEPGDTEADYASDVLDLVGRAQEEASRSRVVEIFVISTADPDRSTTEWLVKDSTQTPAPPSAKPDPSPSATRPTTRHA